MSSYRMNPVLKQTLTQRENQRQKMNNEAKRKSIIIHSGLVQSKTMKLNKRLVFKRQDSTGKTVEYHTCRECQVLKQGLNIVSLRRKKSNPTESNKKYNHLEDCSQKGKF